MKLLYYTNFLYITLCILLQLARCISYLKKSFSYNVPRCKYIPQIVTKSLKYPVITNAYAVLQVKMMVVRLCEISDDSAIC